MEKILLVEDQTELRFILAEWLRMENFDVIEAGTGDEAYTILSSLMDVDLVFTDVQMPGKLNGLDLTRLIKQKYPGIPVIVTSSAISESEALEAGATAFFSKPYRLDMISERISELMPRRESAMPAGNGLKQARP